MAGQKSPTKAKTFPGIQNLHPEESMRFGELREALNVDLVGDPERGIKPRIRPGRSLFVEDPGAHSLWSKKGNPFALYGNLAGELKALFPDKSTQVLVTGIGVRDISFDRVNDRIFWTNGTHCGLVTMNLDVMAWGVENPGQTPVCAPAAAGGLYPGKYLVGCTFIDRWGREGGMGAPQVVEVEAGGGIDLTSIPQPLDADVTTIRLYVSKAGGEVLFKHQDVPVGTLTFLVGVAPAGAALRSSMLFPMPPGQITRFLNGQHLVARGRELFYSPGLWFGQVHPSQGRIGFPEKITLMEPVGDSTPGSGIYIVSGNNTYFLQTTNLNLGQDVTQRRVKTYGAVPGTCRSVDANLIGVEGYGQIPVPVWLASTGQYQVGLPGGTIITLRQNDAVTDIGDKGATMFRESEGHRHLVTSLAGARAPGLRITDRVTVTEYKHYEDGP